MFGGNYIYNHPDCNDQTVYKIGKSNNILQRFKTLSTSYFTPITKSLFIYPAIDSLYSGGYLYFTEKKLHDYFTTKRININREFFKIEELENELLKFISIMDNLGIKLILTSNIKDLKNVQDLSLNKDEEEIINEELLLNVERDLNNKDELLIEELKPINILQPYNDQIEIIEKINSVLNESFIGKLILPPGIGKSFLVSFYIKKYLQDKIILILTPQILISNSFSEALIKCGNTNIININGETDEILSSDPGIYISTYQSMIKQLDTKINFDLIVYDECHHLCAESFKKTIDLTSTKKIFLTATPKLYETCDKNENDVDITFDMNDPKFGSIIYEDNIGNCIQQGKLCDYKIFICDWTNGVKSVCDKLRDFYKRKKIIMFFNTIANSIAIYESLKEYYKIFHIDGKTNKIEKDNILKQFREAEFSILCNVNMVGEGVNIPEIDTIIFMEKRQSAIGIIQNVGRGLRKHKNKDFCMIIMSEKMADRKVLTNLYQNDNRLINKSMYIIDKINFNLEGLIKLIQISDSADNFYYNCELCKAIEAEGHELTENIIVNGILLGDWLSNIKRRYKNNELDSEKIDMMFNIKYVKKWQIETQDGKLGRKCTSDRSFDSMIKRCLDYEEENKNKKTKSKREIDKGNIIGRSSTYNGVKLHGWYQNHTKAYRRMINKNIKNEDNKDIISDDENEDADKNEKDNKIISKFIITKKIKISNKILTDYELSELKKLKTFQNFLKNVNTYKHNNTAESEIIEKSIRFEKMGGIINQKTTFENVNIGSLLHRRKTRIEDISEERLINLRKINFWNEIEERKKAGIKAEPEMSVNQGVNACLEYEKLNGIVYYGMTYNINKLNLWVNRKIQTIRKRTSNKFSNTELLNLRKIEKIKKEIDKYYNLECLQKEAIEEEKIKKEEIEKEEIKAKTETKTYRKKGIKTRHPKEEASDSDD